MTKAMLKLHGTNVFIALHNLNPSYYIQVIERAEMATAAAHQPKVLQVGSTKDMEFGASVLLLPTRFRWG